MAEKRLNDEQKKAVTIDKNGVITAGAGSGKTTVLALRFLRLVKEQKARVDEILTLTFTRKAAAEMYSRIHRHFSENQEDPVINNELSRFELAQISTLDSFCSRIVRGDCAAYGIPEDFRLDQPESAGMIEETAMEFLLSRRDDPSMRRLLDEYDFRRILDEVLVPLGKNGISLARPRSFTGLAMNQFALMERNIDAAVDSLRDITPIIMDLDSSAGKTMVNAQNVISRTEDMDAMLGGREWGRLEELFRDIGKIRKPGKVSKPDLITLKELIEEVKPIALRAAGCCCVLLNREYVFRVSELADEYQKILLMKKRSSGLLAFQDVVELAVEILKNNLSLRDYYKRKYKFIMIDEFQDNNRLQKELLFLLAEKDDRSVPGLPEVSDLSGEKLYFVGDEKQSIYRFRGADVSVFKGLSGELESSGGKRISLDTNYRSEPGLIDFFNSIFPAVLGAGLEDYEAEFLPLKSRDPKLKKPPEIKFFYSGEDFSSEELSGRETEAFHLARYIKDSVETGSLEVYKDGEVKPADYDDFALLFRTGSNQFVFERYFRNMGIPYSVSDVRSLFMEAPANDIYALLQLAVYPEDESAYAALLRSPLINLSDDSLISLMLEGYTEPFSSDSDGIFFRDADRRKYQLGGELYRLVREKADRIPLADLVRWIWYDRGYRLTLLRDPAYHHYLEYYYYLAALARSADDRGLNLAGFLDEIRPNLGKNTKLDELQVLKGKEQGVRIMTIHGSKGLEFPVTILADCGGGTNSSGDKKAPFHFHPETGISLKLAGPDGKMSNPVYAGLEEEEKAREMAELKRLLYVALTRSECHLIVAGRHTANNRKEMNNLLNLFLMGLGWTPGIEPESVPAVADILIPLSPVSREETFRYMESTGARNGASALKLYEAADAATRSLPVVEYPVTGWIQEADEQKEAEGVPAITGGQGFFDWSGEAVLPSLESDELIAEKELETLFGTLCHMMIEERFKGYAAPGRKEALLTDLSGDEARQLLKDGERLCALFFETPFAGELAGCFELESEVSFLMLEQDVYLRGQIDLLARSKEGDEIRVIDFKTDKVKRPDHHKAQLKLYSRAVREMEKPGGQACIRSFLCYLRDGSVEETQFSD